MFNKEELNSGCPSTACFGCGKNILDRFLLTVLDKTWHVDCVRCQQCGDSLEQKCFSRDGNIYCKDDFYRLYGPRCGGCLEGISPTDMVRRAREKTYHLACFTCAICRKQLSTGEELFFIDRDRFICKDDFNNIKAQEYGYSDDEDDLEEKICSPSLPSSCVTPLPASLPPSLPLLHSPTTPKLMESNNNTISSFEATGNSITKIKTEDGEYGDQDGDLQDKLEQDNRSPDPDPGGKRRGPRTTIKAKQLEILKTAFQQTPKPTRHIREQLAKETGLSMRVIQVWFQNKRSKERRMKQLSSGMIPRGFFGGPFGDFGYGGRFPGHPDFFPPGHLSFLPGHPGMPGMEQPLPMTGCPDQFPLPTSLTDKSMSDHQFMSSKGMSDMVYGMSQDSMDGFSMSMDMQRLQNEIQNQRDFVSGCNGDISEQLDWTNTPSWNKDSPSWNRKHKQN